MSRKYLILMAMVFLLALTAVSASDDNAVVNDDGILTAVDGDENTVSAVNTEQLDESSLCDENESTLSAVNTEELDESSCDDGIMMAAENDDKLEKTSNENVVGNELWDLVIYTGDVVKYYGDDDTKFTVRANFDYDYIDNVAVSFGITGQKATTKITDEDGWAYFPINYAVGTYKVSTSARYGDSTDSAQNKVVIKSTIPTKTLTKCVTDKYKKFKIKFLDTKGKALKYSLVMLKIDGKKYKFTTNAWGNIKVRINSFNVGTYKIKAYNLVSKEMRKIKVTITPKTVSFRLKASSWEFSGKRLQTGDIILASASPSYGKNPKGVSIGTQIDDCQGVQKSTRLIKAKVWFKNTNTGKVIVKYAGPAYKGYNIKYVNWIDGYVPFLTKVWYTYRYM